MIVAVEGPSAAGKTTWCRAAAAEFVAEYAPTGEEPDGSDPEAQARYWTGVNGDRWSQAIALERRVGVALCDSDPLKLHYSWCLARIGEAPVARFLHELAAVRAAMLRCQIGFADAVLLTLPDEPALRRQKNGDRTRSRRTFDLHVRLRGPLEEWYRTVDQLRPGTVIWELPRTGAEDLVPAVQDEDRYDVHLLDALASELPQTC
ncbi:hypothetical protein ITJ57_02760 [Plantibacter sp. VKM Ac-2880]|uniref:hypothetical protein n=1 Tax=Plantibacter sp. VKM Ac-2880 TaxID=2783827 RepID=UPI00189088D8|nr:hypothetical protein [Plantibacter sp. VKM Ac-2880]MBF4567677.1 hypothetical protein [Plantibacter sp. VKM Ac-2880]